MPQAIPSDASNRHGGVHDKKMGPSYEDDPVSLKKAVATSMH